MNTHTELLVLLALISAPPLTAAMPHYALDANDFIGPYIRQQPDGNVINTSAHYWHEVVGVAFTRDIDLNIPPTRLDLDRDGKTDTTFSKTIKLKGGLLANPQVAGFIPTPDDPAGTPGRTTISTGFLGVREEMDLTTRQGTGRYGFNCWVCHANTTDRGDIVLGYPNTNINLGLIMASARALDPDHTIGIGADQKPISPDELRRREALDASFDFDSNRDGRVSIREWRQTLSLPSATETQALLMLAGPGRLDQSIDYRMDGTIPLANLQHYMLDNMGRAAFLSQARHRPDALFNPVSIPQNLTGIGAAHYSWTGKESSMRHDAVALIREQIDASPAQIAEWLSIPAPNDHIDYELLSRLLTLDFRNVGTAGRETDFPLGNGWAHRVMTAATPRELRDTPGIYQAVAIRAVLTRHWQAEVKRRFNERQRQLIERGRAVFTDRVVGRILNQRVLHGRETKVPTALKGIAVLAPLDRSKPLTATVPVRCASCHNYSPMADLKPMPARLSPLQRCDLCHFDHPADESGRRYISLREHMKRNDLKSVQGCGECHQQHPDFGMQAYTNSWLLPFDADGDGQTMHDEADDARAGGIGTDALLNIETLFTVQLKPEHSRPKKMYLLSGNAKTVPDKPRFSRQGYGWVRVAPLIGLQRSAPYLHNGSVPTLAALLDAEPQRPTTFPVGRPVQDFTYDTRLPGNRNTGHDYGADLSAEEKTALIAFLASLP